MRRQSWPSMRSRATSMRLFSPGDETTGRRSREAGGSRPVLEASAADPVEPVAVVVEQASVAAGDLMPPARGEGVQYVVASVTRRPWRSAPGHGRSGRRSPSPALRTRRSSADHVDAGTLSIGSRTPRRSRISYEKRHRRTRPHRGYSAAHLDAGAGDLLDVAAGLLRRDRRLEGGARVGIGITGPPRRVLFQSSEDRPVTLGEASGKTVEGGRR